MRHDLDHLFFCFVFVLISAAGLVYASHLGAIIHRKQAIYPFPLLKKIYSLL